MIQTSFKAHWYRLFDRRQSIKRAGAACALAVLVAAAGPVQSAQSLVPPPGPKSGSVGVEGTITPPKPTKAATITNPTSGRVYTNVPIDVSGLCPQGTVVRMFSNNIFVGAVTCTNGSFSLKIDLFSGANELIARVYDDLDQAGPDSGTITVTFNDSSSIGFESRVNITSAYAKKGANPGELLRWPITLSGGVGPYALSVDWGDGKPLTLKSVAFADTVFIDHVYDAAGIYRVIVKASDSRGSTGYLQLIGVANGQVSSSGVSGEGQTGPQPVQVRYSIWPLILTIPIIFFAFWLGRRHQLHVLRRRIEESELQS